MTSALVTFKKELSHLVGFLERKSKTDDLFSKLRELNLIQLENYDIINEYLRNRAIDKVFNYKLFIVTLYGLVEQYIEDIVKQYIRILCQINITYSSFPTKIKEKHTKLSLNLIPRLNYPKFEHIKIEKIIENLHRGLNEDKPIIIPESFLQNGGNYRHKIICSVLNKLGIFINSSLHKYEPLVSHLVSKYQDMEHQNLFYNNSINKLVDERNLIAHGRNLSSITDSTVMIELGNDIDMYISSIDNFIINDINSLYYDQSEHIEFSSKELLKNHTVIIPTLNNISIKKGDKIIAKRGDKHYPQYLIHTVKNIQVDGYNTSFVSCNYDREIGIELEPPTIKKCKYKMFKERSSLFLLPSGSNALMTRVIS